MKNASWSSDTRLDSPVGISATPGTGSTPQRVNTIIDNDIAELRKEVSILVENLEYLRQLSLRYPLLTSPNSWISPHSSSYEIDELDQFERKRDEDYATRVGRNLIWLELTINSLKKKGVDITEEWESLSAIKKAVAKWANYDLKRQVPEYGSISRRRGIVKTIFGMEELGLSIAWDDRLREWDFEKYRQSRAKAWFGEFPKTFLQIQNFLTYYHGKPVRLKRVTSIDPGNGHNLLSYWFEFIEWNTK